MISIHGVSLIGLFRLQSNIEEMFPGAPADFLNTLNDVLYKYLVEDEVDEETDLNPILIVRPLDPLALVCFNTEVCQFDKICYSG